MTQPQEATSMTDLVTIRNLVKNAVPWSETDEADLRRMFAEQRDVDDMATHLGRTRNSVWGKLGSLGLIKRPQTAARFCNQVEPAAQFVAEYFGVTLLALRGPDQWRGIAWPRQVAMWLAVETGRTYSAIGRYFKRDHTTAMYSQQKVELLRQRDPKVLQLTDALLAAFLENTPVPPPAPIPEPEPLPTPEIETPVSDDPVTFYEAAGGNQTRNSRAYMVKQNERFAAAMRAALEGTP